MKNLYGKRVLITGAARGIGYHTAQAFAKHGAHLLLCDLDEQALMTTAAELASTTTVHAFTVDVSNRERVDEIAADILSRFQGIDILINNAGVGHTDEITDTPIETWDKLMGINFFGPLYFMYAFLPYMLSRGEGHIVNISSGQAFFRLPTWGVYASLKLALGSVSDILHYELLYRGVKVTTVYPFMVNTGFYDDIKPTSWGARVMMSLKPYYSNKPQTVAKKILKATMKEKRVEMVSCLNWFGYYMPFIPFARGILSRLVYGLFCKDRELPKNVVNTNKIYSLISMLKQRRVGFAMDETMTGSHSFAGEKEKRPMEFKVTWGARHILKWLNPFGSSFMKNYLRGVVTIDGLCHLAYCEGTLELMYFTKRKIRYSFEFEVDGTRYVFTGEKRNIWPWNLHRSHTTCFGELVVKGSRKVVSHSITHFKLRTLPSFLLSFRLG